MSIQVKVLLMLLSIAGSSSTTVKSGAYHNVVIEVEKDVPVDDCSNFLLSLEVRYFDRASLLFSQPRTRQYFAFFQVHPATFKAGNSSMGSHTLPVPP